MSYDLLRHKDKDPLAVTIQSVFFGMRFSFSRLPRRDNGYLLNCIQLKLVGKTTELTESDVIRMVLSLQLSWYKC